MRISLRACYETLGLPTSASAEEVVRAYRMLAKRYHPDVNPTPAAREQFVAIATAYARLRRARQGSRRGDVAVYDACPRCDGDGPLRPAPDGAPACSACLSGEAYRRRLLPLPIVRVARHVAVFVFYAAALVLLVWFARVPEAQFLLAALACVLAGFGVLAVEVLRAGPPVGGWRVRPRPAPVVRRRRRRRSATRNHPHG